MQKDIHPKYYPNCKVTCVCGHTFTTGSTEPEFRVELCSHCHPFYTGKQKLVDTARRVEKFSAKVKAQESVKDKKGKKIKRAARAAKRADKEVVVKTKDIKKIAQVKLNKK